MQAGLGWPRLGWAELSWAGLGWGVGRLVKDEVLRVQKGRSTLSAGLDWEGAGLGWSEDIWKAYYPEEGVGFQSLYS